MFILRLPDVPGAEGGAAPAETGGDTRDSGLQNIVESAIKENNENKEKSESTTENVVDSKPKEDLTKDQEIELGLNDDKGQPMKWKKAELTENIKWFMDNREAIAKAIQLKELSGKHPSFKSLLENVLSRSFDEKGTFNEDFAKKALSSFEEKKAEVKETIEEKDDSIDEMKAMLEELDQDSPQAKILAKNIANQEKQKSALKETLETLNSIKSKVEGIEKQKQAEEEQKKKETSESENARILEIFNKEVAALCDEKTSKTPMKFAGDDEKEMFLGLVKNAIASMVKPNWNDEDFKAGVQSASKAVFEKLSKWREHWNLEYAKNKGWKVNETPPESKPKEDQNGYEETENFIMRELEAIKK